MILFLPLKPKVPNMFMRILTVLAALLLFLMFVSMMIVGVMQSFGADHLAHVIGGRVIQATGVAMLLLVIMSPIGLLLDFIAIGKRYAAAPKSKA